MYKWAVRFLIRRNIAAMGRGDYRPLLSGYADDAVMVFPGQSSWSGEHRGKAAIEAFLTRFLAAGLHGEAYEILVNGPPWRTVVCVLFTDRAEDAQGHAVYENRVALVGHARWGKIIDQEDYLDTQKVADFDVYLAERELLER
jgi:ketosteroid isomerase-like protein